MGKIYKNGIVSPKGFDMSAAEPTDQREIVAFKNDLYTLANVYPGIEIKIVEEDYAEYKLIRLPSTEEVNWIISSEGIIGPTGPQGIQGPKGDTGPQGITGPSGSQGIPGVTGATGLTGPSGAQGVQGVQGATGPQGPKGDQGIQGIQGDIGATGATGSGITILGSDTIANILIKSGSSGDMWIATDSGLDDLSQTVTIGDGIVYDTVNWLTVGPIRGPQGIQGIQGDTGATGAAGADGAQGDQGIQGIQGDTGLTGDQGIQGIQGIQGLTGDAGTNGTDGTDGVDGLGWTGGSYNTGTGIITFTSNDGLGFVTNDLRGIDGIDGNDGAIGPQGIQGVQGPIGPEGPEGSVDPFAIIKVIITNYTTLNADSNTTLNVKNPTTEITLDSALLTTGFRQQAINDTASNLTITVVPADQTTGDGAKTFIVPIGHFAYYILSSTQTWSVSVGALDSTAYMLKSVYAGATSGVVKDSELFGGALPSAFGILASSQTWEGLNVFKNNQGIQITHSTGNNAGFGGTVWIGSGDGYGHTILGSTADIQFTIGSTSETYTMNKVGPTNDDDITTLGFIKNSFTPRLAVESISTAQNIVPTATEAGTNRLLRSTSATELFVFLGEDTLHTPGECKQMNFVQTGAGQITFNQNATTIISNAGTTPSTAGIGSAVTCTWISQTEILIVGDIVQ